MDNVAVSACLLGYPCRWHGKAIKQSKAVTKLISHSSVIPVCPEMASGLPTPRPAVKRLNSRIYETCADKSQRKFHTGTDITDKFTLGANLVLFQCQALNIKKAILCKWSPSCDKNGITGRLLIKHGIEVINSW